VVQSGVGFGFALVAAPVLATVYPPDRAVPTIAVLGLLVSALTLGVERRTRTVMRPVAGRLIVASVPGMVAGAVILARAPADALRLLVAVSVLAAVVVQARAKPSPDGPHGPAGDAAAGLISGALATTTGLNGPPLVVRLLQRGATATQMRDTLAVIFVVASVLMIAILLVGGALDPAPALPGLIAATIAGQLLGRRAFERIHHRHREVTLGVLVLTALAALAPALRALTG
jgi:uncharacterized protein